MALTSSIYHRAHSAPPAGEEAQRRNELARQEAWTKHGLAVIDPTTIADDWFSDAVTSWANGKYGQRIKK